jgi:monothiol glutaredoxin
MGQAGQLREKETFMAEDVKSRIDEKVKNNKIMPFATEDVLADPAIREGIKRYSNWPTIPQVYIDGKFVGGCDILHELHERGELEPMLKSAFGK